MNTSGRSNPPQSGRELGTLEFYIAILYALNIASLYSKNPE